MGLGISAAYLLFDSAERELLVGIEGGRMARTTRNVVL